MSASPAHYIYGYAWDEASKSWKTVIGEYSPSGSAEPTARKALAYSVVPAGATKGAVGEVWTWSGKDWQWLGTTTIYVFGWSTGAEKEKVIHTYGGVVLP